MPRFCFLKRNTSQEIPFGELEDRMSLCGCLELEGAAWREKEEEHLSFNDHFICRAHIVRWRRVGQIHLGVQAAGSDMQVGTTPLSVSLQEKDRSLQPCGSFNSTLRNHSHKLMAAVEVDIHSFSLLSESTMHLSCHEADSHTCEDNA